MPDDRAHRARRHRHDLRAGERRDRRSRPVAFRVDEPNADVAVGNVIRTDPDAGASVSPGQQVRVYVSTGQETATVPALEGLATGCRDRRALRQPAWRSARSPRATIPASRRAPSSPPISRDRVPRSRSARRSTSWPRPGASSIIDVTGYTVEAATRELEGPESQLVVDPAGGPRRARRRTRRPSPRSPSRRATRRSTRRHPHLLLRALSPAGHRPPDDLAAPARRSAARVQRGAARRGIRRIPTVSSQLPSSRCPPSVSTASGWNCTPWIGDGAVRDPHDDAAVGAARHHELGREASPARSRASDSGWP